MSESFDSQFHFGETFLSISENFTSESFSEICIWISDAFTKFPSKWNTQKLSPSGKWKWRRLRWKHKTLKISLSGNENATLYMGANIKHSPFKSHHQENETDTLSGVKMQHSETLTLRKIKMTFYFQVEKWNTQKLSPWGNEKRKHILREKHETLRNSHPQKTENRKFSVGNMKQSEKISLSEKENINSIDNYSKNMFLGVNPCVLSLRKGSSPISPGYTYG